MVTSPYEWKILEWDDNPKQTKEQTLSVTISVIKELYKYYNSSKIDFYRFICDYDTRCS